MSQPALSGLGEWLRKRCDKVSLREVAAKTGLSHTTIAAVIKSGSASPETIRKLARAFGGDGRQGVALEDILLTLAGHRSQPLEGEGLTEPMARLLDKLDNLSEPQLKVMERFADFLSGMEAK